MESKKNVPAVLITGCSSGHGKALAKLFARNGYPTYASARSLESIEDLKKLGCDSLRIDVTDDRSIQEAVRTIEKKHNTVGILVNNAAIGKELMTGVHKVANDAIQEGLPEHGLQRK